MVRGFSGWLKRERQARNLSIRQLANMVGFSHSLIAKIEKEEAVVTWDFCVAIARTFSQPVWKLFIMAGLLDKVPEEVYSDEKIRVLINSFEQLPDSGKDELLRYASWLVHQHTNNPE